MDDFPKRLLPAYRHYLRTGIAEGMFFKNPDQTNGEFKQELTRLENAGYFIVLSNGLGLAEIELADLGIELCQKLDKSLL